MSPPDRRGVIVLGLIAAFAACGGVTIDNQPAGSSGTTGVGGASTATTSAATAGSGGAADSTVVAAVSSSASGLPPCITGPDEDKDGDGFTTAEGDCNDCDAQINPNAIEVIVTGPLPGDGGVPVPADDDCNGTIDEVVPLCDESLSLADTDPLSAAHAIDLCKASTGPKSWGIVDASWVLADGAPLPADPAQLASYHLGHGILSTFGPNNPAQLGKNLLVLSTGTARRPTDPGYQSVAGFDKGFASGAPPGFPLQSPSCPGALSGAPRDAVALEIALRAPSNAGGFSFYSTVFSRSWPARVCSAFDDAFMVLQAPPPPGSVAGRINFDANGNPETLNAMSLDACTCAAPPCLAPPMGPTQKLYACPLGPALLTGTGFEGSAASGWLWTLSPVQGGSEFSLRFTVWDGEDGLFDTTTLVDAFRWISKASLVPIVSEGPPPGP